MTPEEKADLQKAAILAKAKAKVMVKHFQKAEKHHKGHAEDDEKCEMAHKARAEEHEKKLDKADDDQKDYHKASAAFHKSLAKFAERMGKREKEYADHNKAMSEACAEDDAKKLFKLLDIDESELPTGEDMTKIVDAVPATPAAPAAAVVTPKAGETAAPAAVVPSAAALGFNETISKALDNKLTEAVDAAFERVLSSDDFGKKVDQAIAGKLLEKLGSSTVATDIKTFPVPRPGAKPGDGDVTIGKVNLDGLDAELAELCKVD